MIGVICLSKPSTTAKRRYNRAVYDRYEFVLNKDSMLNARLSQHAADGKSVAALVKSLLCQHFGTSLNEIHSDFILRSVDGMTVKVPNPLPPL